MTLGEIKAEALKLMFVDIVTDYESEDIDSLANDEYCRDYLVNMPGAINRCFSNLESRGVVPSKRAVLSIDNAYEVRGNISRYDLRGCIADYMRLERLIYESADGDYEGCDGYVLEADVLACRTIPEDARYIAIYKPCLTRVSYSTPNDTVINLPDNIASLIPYFIKGELFRADEPDEAQEARRWYESGIDEMLIEQQSVQMRVKSVFSLSDLEDL